MTYWKFMPLTSPIADPIFPPVMNMERHPIAEIVIVAGL